MDHKCNGWGRGKEKISFLSYASLSLLLSWFGFALSWTGYPTGWRRANWQNYRMTAYTGYRRQTPGILLNSGWHLNRELSLTEVRLWYVISNNNYNSHSHVFIGTTHFLFLNHSFLWVILLLLFTMFLQTCTHAFFLIFSILVIICLLAPQDMVSSTEVSSHCPTWNTCDNNMSFPFIW